MSNENCRLIKGSVCGVKVETIDSLMQQMRYLDKLVDELAKEKPLRQKNFCAIMRKNKKSP